jgi:hypothetical protein
MPIVIPLSRPWPQRLWAGLRAAALALSAARRRRRAERQLCRLPEAMLEDMAAPDEWRAAAAQCRAREAMDRSLLRVGIVAGARW